MAVGKFDRLWQKARVSDLADLSVIILDEMKSLCIDNFKDYVANHFEALDIMYKSQNISDDQIASVLDAVICNQAEAYMDTLADINKFSKPEFLAYALEKNHFSMSALERFSLLNNKNRNSFISQHRNESLITDLRKQYIDLKPSLKYS